MALSVFNGSGCFPLSLSPMQFLTVSHVCWLSLTVSSSAIESLHVS